MSKAIVTRENLNAMLESANQQRRSQIIGRALVHLFNRQTADERISRSTNQDNSRGFTAFDAEIGTRDAKTFIRDGALTWYQVNWWMGNRRGFPRICSYHRQLNEEAVAKVQRDLDSKKKND